MRRTLYISIISLFAAFSLLSCSKEIAPALQEEGEITLPMMLSGGVTAFDSPTKAPEEFTFSNENVIYLRLQNTKDENKPLIGRATYSNDQWKFTFQGSYENLTGGKVEAYLFENNYSKARSILSISYRTPVYGTTEGSYNIVNDTLKIKAALKPLTGRVTFVKEEDTSVYFNRFAGISYYTSFDIDNFTFGISSKAFESRWNYYGEYYYGFLTNEENPILVYQGDGYCVSYAPDGFLEQGKSGYLQLPTGGNYNGWLYCGYEFDQYDNYRWVYFRFVGAGTFILGGNGDTPPHLVTITKPFFILGEEVSRDLWPYVYEDNEFEYDNIAVTGKSHEQILDFCEKLSKKWNNYTFRLPTEDEWELAARGGILNYSDWRYSGGDNLRDNVRLYTDEEYNEDNPFYFRIRQRNPNGCSLYDMSGNAAELCSDWYDENETYHVVRGGSAFDYDKIERLTVTHRCSEADYDPSEIGFRIVVEVNPFMFD